MIRHLGSFVFFLAFYVAAVPGNTQDVSAREFMTRIPTIENPEELSLDPALKKQLEAFFPHQSASRKNLQKVIFASPSKGLKIQATQWIALRTRQNAYRVIPSRVVSEYSSETEKNLELVFDEGENEDAILFFDEADALFGKTNANDEDAKNNKEKIISYFLGKADRYSTTIILSCTQPKNLDPAIIKKFREVVVIK